MKCELHEEQTSAVQRGDVKNKQFSDTQENLNVQGACRLLTKTLAICKRDEIKELQLSFNALKCYATTMMIRFFPLSKMG